MNNQLMHVMLYFAFYFQNHLRQRYNISFISLNLPKDALIFLFRLFRHKGRTFTNNLSLGPDFFNVILINFVLPCDASFAGRIPPAQLKDYFQSL